MAEKSTEESWWGWIQTAKDKVVAQSSEVLEFVKNDIDEFTKVVSEETSTMVSSTASALKTKLKLDEDDSTASTVKKSVGGFLSHVADVFTPPPDDSDEEAFVICNQQPVMLSRLEANIYTQIKEADTFLQDPLDEEDYNSWLESFDMDSKQIEMADLLVTCKPLHKHFTNLVPTQVSHSLFWHRYFYLVHCMQRKEEKRKAISDRANIPLNEQIKWEDDEALQSEVDITEEMQTKLLQQYEEELQSNASSEHLTTDGNDQPIEDTKTAADENTKAATGETTKPLTDETKPDDKKQTNKKKSKVASEQPKSVIKKDLTELSPEKETKDKKNKPKNKKKEAARASPAKSLNSDCNEDEWEKVEAETDSGITSAVTSPVSDEEKKGDWETWE